MITINTNSNNNCSFIPCPALCCPLKVCLIESYSNLNVTTHKNLRTSGHLLLMVGVANQNHHMILTTVISLKGGSCICLFPFPRIYVCYVYLRLQEYEHIRVQIHVEAWGTCWESSSIPMTPYSSLNQTQHSWTWLLTLGIPTSVFWGLELQVDITPTWHLHRSWESELWSSHLQGKHLNHWAISPEKW